MKDLTKRNVEKNKEGINLKGIIILDVILFILSILFVVLGNVTRGSGSHTVHQQYPQVYFAIIIMLIIGVIILLPIIYHSIYKVNLVLIKKTLLYLIELILGIFIITAMIFLLTNYTYIDILNGVFGNGEFDKLTQLLLGLCNIVSIGMFVGIFTNLYEKEIDDRLE